MRGSVGVSPIIILLLCLGQVIYKRYASLFFITCVDRSDNELVTLEMIHLFVEILDRYFGNVCELDIIFNFHKAYYILDEVRGNHPLAPVHLRSPVLAARCVVPSDAE
jgi:hypothetical protein